MNLSQSQLQFIKDELLTKWTGLQECPLCSQVEWSLGDSVFRLSEFHIEGGLRLSGPSVPVLPITCSNCGNTVLINALVSGILAVEEAEVPAEAVGDDETE